MSKDMKWDELPREQRADLVAWLRCAVADWRKQWGDNGEKLKGADALEAAIAKLEGEQLYTGENSVYPSGVKCAQGYEANLSDVDHVFKEKLLNGRWSDDSDKCGRCGHDPSCPAGCDVTGNAKCECR